jgi:uncharacterized membrane protein (DUF4010 family)
VALKLLGARGGLLLTGLCGGLVSSTATTLALVRRSRDIDPSLHGAVTAGIAATTATMMLRVIVLATAMRPSLFVGLVVPFGLMAGTGGAIALARWRQTPSHETRAAKAPGNPLDLRAALVFAALLAAMMIGIRACQQEFGTGGLYVLAAVAGLVDVDAVTLSIAQQGELAQRIAVTGMFIAATVNTLIKAAIAIRLGSGRLARSIVSVLLAVIVAGALGLAGLGI